MENKRRAVHGKKIIKFNVALFVISAILLYVIACLIISLTKKPISTYKVNKSNVNNDVILEGIAVRNEQVLSANSTGYTCYYAKDGEKVKNGVTICTIDQSGQLFNSLEDAEGYDDILSADDYRDIRSTISTYKASYTDDSFYNAYNFETSVNNKVLELANEVLMQQMSSNGTAISYSSVTTPESGIVTYYIDGYENFNESSLSATAFDRSSYKKETLKTGEMIDSGKPVVKLIPDETWYIYSPISEEQLKTFTDEKYVTFKINNSSFDMTMPYEVINGNDGTYLKITLQKYLCDFLSERYVSVELIMDEDTGLKIPVSALTEKEVYIIPENYFSGGANQTAYNKLYIQDNMEDGKSSVKTRDVTIYKIEDGNYYIDTSNLQPSDVIQEIGDDSQVKSSISVATLPTATLQGVYSATRGSAEFEMVTVKKTVDDFALIESGEYVKVYDNIILDSSQVKENQIIY